MGVNFNSNNTYIQSPELQHRMGSQENFGAIDKEKLKQDTAQFSQKTQENVKEDIQNVGLVKAAKNAVPKNNIKKFFTSLGLVLATTIGFAVLGNKSTNFMTKLGLKVDDVLLNSKWYTQIGDTMKNAKKGLAGFLSDHSKTYNDIVDTFKNRHAKQKCDAARGYGNGLLGIHAMTPLDILDKVFKKKGLLVDNKKVQQETAKTLKTIGNLSGFSDEAIEEISTLALKGKTNKLIKEIQKGSFDEAKATEICKNILAEVSSCKSTLQDKSIDDVAKVLENLVGSKNSTDLAKEILGFAEGGKPLAKGKRTNIELCSMLTDGIAENFGIAKGDKKGLYNVLETMKKGKGKINGVDFDFTEFNDIVMKDSGFSPMRLISDWWPTNIVNSIGKKIAPNKYKPICLGNFGDSMIKYNVVKGNMAQTLPAKFIQNLIGAPAESVSNFYNDKSGMGFFLCYQMLNLFNNVQDAPKEQKVSTVADDFITTMGGFVLATPLAFKATYGLATLANLKGESIFTKILKPVGKFFNMGLDKIAADSTITSPKGKLGWIGGKVGGVMRFVLIMVTFSNMFRKPIQKLTHKIFGKPYDPAEAERQAQIETQKNTIIPELGITQGEFIEKINSNPQAIEALQNKPQLLAQMQKNPKLLIDYLDGKPIDENPIATNISKNGLSPANSAILNRGTNRNLNPNLNQNPAAAAPLLNNNAGTNTNAIDLQKTQNENAATIENKTEEVKNETKNIDNVTYIPSSDFVAKDSNYTDTQTQQINEAMAKADKVLARAEQYM